MACPRCGHSLVTLNTQDAQASYCEACEYVGVSADFHPESAPDTETWQEALTRFQRRRTNTTESDPPDPDQNDGR